MRDAGFDIVYLPPDPSDRREASQGRNNSVTADAGDVGSPWAIGAAEGGHAAIHPDLGTIDDFDALVAAANERGLEIALDIAFQCSPDHPWVSEHPEWFAIRPDGTIAYAENPPKRYQDIVPFDFDIAGLARRCGRRSPTSSASGAATACACSASTTRTPSRSRSGSG